ncbi:MAG TPA: hypothetical protein ENI73_03655 [Spirochaetes bacterium]|nr:hypothetical protein [Spirochaetota bacterium]
MLRKGESTCSLFRPLSVRVQHVEPVRIGDIRPFCACMAFRDRHVGNVELTSRRRGDPAGRPYDRV